MTSVGETILGLNPGAGVSFVCEELCLQYSIHDDLELSVSRIGVESFYWLSLFTVLLTTNKWLFCSGIVCRLALFNS